MAPSREPTEGISVAHVLLQLSLMSLVFFFWYEPFVQPIKIMVVLFHEMSHGLMALATGGSVLAIEITQQEGGFCETEGGIAVLIVSAGYLGSMFFGGMMLYLSRVKNCVPAVYGILSIVLAVAIFSVLRDPYSKGFAAAVAVTFVVVGVLAPAAVGGLFLRLLGTVSCLYSIFDIYSDVLEQSEHAMAPNDALAFSELTGYSAHSVGAMWLGISIVYFVVILKIDLTRPSDAPPVRERRPQEATSAA